MSRRRRQDQELWNKVKATVKPLSSNRAEFTGLLDHEPANTPATGTKNLFQHTLPKIKTQEPEWSLSWSPKPRVLDPAISRKIAKGRISIEGKIDLHGLTQVEAHQRLWRFLESSFHSGKRTVLVITGKGERGQGVLRRAVPQWLEGPDFRNYVSGSQEAHLGHGGSGALYVRIKQNRGRFVQ